MYKNSGVDILHLFINTRKTMIVFIFKQVIFGTYLTFYRIYMQTMTELILFTYISKSVSFSNFFRGNILYKKIEILKKDHYCHNTTCSINVCVWGGGLRRIAHLLNTYYLKSCYGGSGGWEKYTKIHVLTCIDAQCPFTHLSMNILIKESLYIFIDFNNNQNLC